MGGVKPVTTNVTQWVIGGPAYAIRRTDGQLHGVQPEELIAYLNALEDCAALTDELADWMQFFDIPMHFKDAQQAWLKRAVPMVARLRNLRGT